eukprot:8235212-Pyramimonas_sp.AAC.1
MCRRMLRVPGTEACAQCADVEELIRGANSRPPSPLGRVERNSDLDEFRRAAYVSSRPAGRARENVDEWPPA